MALATSRDHVLLLHNRLDHVIAIVRTHFVSQQLKSLSTNEFAMYRFRRFETCIFYCKILKIDNVPRGVGGMVSILGGILELWMALFLFQDNSKNKQNPRKKLN